MDASRWVLFKYVDIVDKIVEQQYMNKYYHSKNDNKKKKKQYMNILLHK